MFSKKNLIISIILLGSINSTNFSMIPPTPEEHQAQIDRIQKLINQKLDQIENLKRARREGRLNPQLEQQIKQMEDMIELLRRIKSGK